MNKYLLNIVLGALLFAAPAFASAAETTMCTMQYQPVCGAKQVQCVAAPCYPVYHTYGNSCVLGVEKGSFIHEGECLASETGPVKPAQPYVPPANCTAWFDGCNRCSKSASGQAMCTLMACMGEPKAGYCTAYEKPATATPPVASETPPTSTPDTAQNTIPDTASVPATGPNFFQRIWNAFMSWFRFW